MNKKFVSIKVDLDRYNEIKEYYSSFLIEKTGDYVDFMAKVDDVLITGFESKKNKKSITFNGEDAS